MSKKVGTSGYTSVWFNNEANTSLKDERYFTLSFENGSDLDQLIFTKSAPLYTMYRNNKWTEQYRFATTSMLSDYVPKSDLAVSSANLQSKQNVSEDSNIKFCKYGKIVVAHVTVTTTSEVSGYNVLKLGVIPNGFRPNFECRSLILRQQSNESRILAFTTSGDINLWNWSSNAGITTPSGSAFCGEAVFCVA